MHTKKLLGKIKTNLMTPPLKIHVDSKSINQKIEHSNDLARRILKFSSNDEIFWVRSELTTTNFPEEIIQYFLKKEGEEIKGVYYNKNGLIAEYWFGYKMNDILKITKRIYNRLEVSNEEISGIVQIFIQAILNKREDTIFLTENETLLKNRLWFESHFPGLKLNIMDLKELGLFLDLFFKKESQKYYASSKLSVNKGYWYSLSACEKIARFRGNLLCSEVYQIYDRFCYLLMALDEMGIEFYCGVDNDTKDNSRYHFNYALTLMCGIFDNLALFTNSRLNVKFPYENRISLNNFRSKDFIKEIEKKNPRIKELIIQNRAFIQLIHHLRDQIIHREGLKSIKYNMKDTDFAWEYSFLILDRYSLERLTELNGLFNAENSLTNWGIYQGDEETYLEIWHFTSKAIDVLSKLINNYLSLLGVNKRKMKDSSFKIFNKNHLGY